MKRMDRKNWDSVKNMEIISGKFEDGRNYRIFKCPKTGLIELILDHKDLQKQNQGVRSDNKLEASYQGYVAVSGFGSPE